MAPEPSATPPFTVVVCTRDRPEKLNRTLEALEGQSRGNFPVTVVDQGAELDARLERKAAKHPGVTLIRDDGRGVSRARNIGWRNAETEWVVFLDDDAIPARDWAAELELAMAGHPEVSCISGYVGEDRRRTDDYSPISVSDIATEEVVRGRWTRPARIGLGVCMAFRQSSLVELSGYDERLGPGTPEFLASEDMDLNYRFLRHGGAALITPRIRVIHHQWRSQEEVEALWRDYLHGWAGFSMKHLKGGDIAGGIWLWALGFNDAASAILGGLRRRSWHTLRIARSRFIGLISGTAAGLRNPW